MPGREPRARLDEAGVALRDRDGEAGADERPLARRELDALAGRRGRGRRRPRTPAVGTTASSRSRWNGSSITRSPGSPLLLRRVGDEEARVAAQVAPRQPRDHEHAVGRVLAALDRRAERVQLRERGAVGVREQQPHHLPAARELLGEPLLQLLEPLPGLRGDLRRAREAVREAAAADLVDAVDLVQHELHRQLLGADLAEHLLDGAHHAVELVVVGRAVGDVQHDVGDERLLERGREPLDQLMRQAADEADRVGDEVAAPLVLEAARGRVERLEQAVLDRDTSAPVSAFRSVDLPTFV